MATITPAAVYPINAGGFTSPAGTVAYGGTAYSGTFIPALWSGKLAKKFYTSTVFGEIANTDWQGEIANMGDTVIINTVPTITTYAYQAGQQLNYDVPAPATLTLKINKGRYFGVNVNDVMELQAKPKLMEMFTDDAAQQMKIAIDADVLYSSMFDAAGDLVSDANGHGAIRASHAGATAGSRSGAYNLGTDLAPVNLTPANILSYFTALSSVLDEADVPEDGRWLVISPFERQILMQSPAAQAQFMGDPQSMLRNGKIGVIDRFTVYVSNLLPRAAVGKKWDNSTNLTNALKRHAVYAGHKSGLSFASQISKVESLQNPNDFGTLVRGLNIYGNMVSQGSGLVLLRVAG